MVKKSVVYGALLATVCMSPSLAHSYYKSGFLAGAHVGMSFGNGKFNSTFNPNNALIPSSAASGSARKTSALFGILGGYRHIIQDGMTLGVDLTGNVYTSNEFSQNLQHNTTVANVPTTFPFVNKLNRRWSIIPSVNIGKIFCGRWHAYLGLGLAITSFRLRVNAPFPTSTNPLNSASSSVTKVGFVPSIGAEYAATQNVSIVGSVSYEIYQKISKTYGNQLTAPTLTTSSYSASISPRYVNLKLGAIYRF